MSRAIEAVKKKRINRAALIRDTAVFQVKLAMDGIVDLLLVPVSLIGAAISFVTGRETFYDTMRTGFVMDRRINLFGAVRRFDGETEEDGIEKLARRLEVELQREYKEGNLRASAKSAIDRLVTATKNRRQ